MAGTNRRKVIIGAAALGLTGTSPVEAAGDTELLALGAEMGSTGIVPTATAGDTELLALGSDVAKLRRRCQRLAQQVRRAGDDKSSWARWSAAVDERSNLLQRIAQAPAHGIAGVAIKVQAIAWELLDDDLIVDDGARKRVVALGRDLGRLVLK